MNRSATLLLEESPSRASGSRASGSTAGGENFGEEWPSPQPAPSGVSKLGRIQSAPLLHQRAANSTHVSTWYSGSSAFGSTTRQACWKPLGSTWRDWETDGLQRVRKSPDDGSQFVHGCVPHWGRESSIRMKGVIEHELTWAYYRMRRHVQHPLRKEIGPMGNKADGFQFWRDLRPPFSVLNVAIIDEHESASSSAQPHADGDLYKVTYECGIDYHSERQSDSFGEGGTFDNRIHGDALVRFASTFPEKRPLRIVSWGEPMLNWTPKDDQMDAQMSVDPSTWMPIAEVLGMRADAPQLQQCRALTREATRKKQAKDRRGVEVPELERLLLGPHASLPRLAAATQKQIKSRGLSAGPPGAAGTPVRKRSHTIWTSAAGFVRYAG